MVLNNMNSITLVNFNHISIHSYDTCVEKFGKPDAISKKLIPLCEDYINAYAFKIVCKNSFFEKVKLEIINYIYEDENKIYVPSSDSIQNILLSGLLLDELKTEYKKLLSTIKFAKKVYSKYNSSFLEFENELVKNVNSYYLTFNLFLMLVYEFYKVRNKDINLATFKSFEIMDMLFGSSWCDIFYGIKETKYLEFLEKYVYSNVIGKSSFLFEFNFKGLKNRYMEYLLSKTKKYS